MKTTRIKAVTADYAKWSYTQQVKCRYDAAVDILRRRVFLDYTLVRAMHDDSVPLAGNLRDSRTLRISVAENIKNIDIANKRYEAILKYSKHPVRACVETNSAKEFDQVILRDKDSILSSIEDVRVGDAVDFALYDANARCVRLSRVYRDDNHNWVSLDDAPYVTGWKAWIADPINKFNLFTDLVD